MPYHRSEEYTSELQSPCNLVCRLLLEKKNKKNRKAHLRHRTTVRPRVTDRQRRTRRGCAYLLSLSCSVCLVVSCFFFFFFFNDTATTEIYTLSLHDALPIYLDRHLRDPSRRAG